MPAHGGRLGTAWISILASMLLVQCSSPNSSLRADHSSVATPEHGRGLFAPGAGTFEFVLDGQGPHPSGTITVWYFAPTIDLSRAQVLVVMPGRPRNAEEYRNDWLEEADPADAILLVPELPPDDYPLAAYNLGNLVDDHGEPVPPVGWTFAIVEALFDHVVAETKSYQPGYYLYGHSAGAQFVHRLMLFLTDNRVLRAVSANAGWYTVPDPSIDFPYGLRGGPPLDDSAVFFTAPLNVLLGADDNDPEADGLRSTPEADRQGSTRLDRGRHFVAEAGRRAEELDVPFAWKLDLVPGASHSNREMAPAAAEVLFG